MPVGVSTCMTSSHPLRAGQPFHAASVQQQQRARSKTVCMAREKGVGSILRGAMTTKQRAPDLVYQAAAAYLRGIGITNQSELTMVLDIATNPYSIYGKARNRKQPTNPHARKLSVDGDLRPVVEYLLSLGLDESAVAGVILRHPAVLCYSVDERLRPFVDFLVGEMQLPQEQVVQAVRERPNMLGLELEGVKRIVGYLAANGKTTEEIAQLLQTSV